MCLRSLLCWLLLCFCVPALAAQRPESAYKAGLRAEQKNNYDLAYESFKVAHAKKPNEPRYTAAFLRARLYASSQHVMLGQQLRDVAKLQDALVEFRRATEIDPSSFAAQQEIRRTTELMNRRAMAETIPAQRVNATYLERAAASTAGPVSLVPASNEPITLHMVSTADVVYKTIGKLAGLNVLLDPEFKPGKVNIELKDVNVRDALSMLATQTRTFWRPLSSNTILVSADGARRKDVEQNVMMTFYLHNAATPAELNEAATTLKSILDISRIQITPEQRSLTLRGTPDQMVLAQKLLEDIDKPRAEVMIEVAVLEVSRGRIRNLGVNPPTTINATIQPNASTTGGTTGGSFTINQLSPFTANNVLISVPSVSLTALMSDSNTKVLQKPQIRAMDSEKATLKIGDRIPIATGSYQSGLTNGVNTQFTYIDVGVNVDIIPYVHANGEVTLKLAFEVSSVTGQQSIDGVTEPTIGQRRIEHQTRLKDGEVNMIAGILQDSESHSMSGWPLLGKVPILRYLFGQDNKDREQNEIVFAITPHIVRSLEVNEENVRMVDLGSGGAVSYRTVDGPAAAAPAAAPVPIPAVPAQRSSVPAPVPVARTNEPVAP